MEGRRHCKVDECKGKCGGRIKHRETKVGRKERELPKARGERTVRRKTEGNITMNRKERMKYN